MKNSERIDPKTLKLKRFTLLVKCFCGECESENKYYECKGCSRIVPWCFGGGDHWWEYCDDCWVVLNREQEKTKSGASPGDDRQWGSPPCTGQVYSTQ